MNSEIFKDMLRNKKLDPTKVKVIWVSPPYPDYIWVANCKLPAKKRQIIQKFFLDLTASNPVDQPILAALDAQYYVKPNLKNFQQLQQIAKQLKML